MEREEHGGERPLSKIYLRQGHQKGVGGCKGQELEGQSLHTSTVLDYNKTLVWWPTCTRKIHMTQTTQNKRGVSLDYTCHQKRYKDDAVHTNMLNAGIHQRNSEKGNTTLLGWLNLPKSDNAKCRCRCWMLEPNGITSGEMKSSSHSLKHLALSYKFEYVGVLLLNI